VVVGLGFGVVSVVCGLELVGRTGGSPVPVLESEVGIGVEDGDLLVVVGVVVVVLGALVVVVVVAALDVTGIAVVVVGGITVTEDAMPVL